VDDDADESPSRVDLERYYLRLHDRRLRDAQEDLSSTGPRAWAYGFAGNPRGFIGELIGPEWNGPDWIAWRAFISVVFGQDLQTIGEWRIFERCTELDHPPPERPPSVWMPIGRRGGKSRMLAAIAVHMACCYDWTPYLDPGELGVIPVLAADRRQARTIMGYVKAFLEHEKLRGLIAQESAESIRLHGDLLIEVVTASFRAVRSRTVLAALCDEIAFWHSEESSANPDREIIAALQPAMATIPNALLLGASSPYARHGVLWDNFDRYFGKPNGPLIWKAPTRVMNPTVPQSFVDEQYAEDPLSAAAEYGAEFRSDVDGFLSRDVMDAAVMRGVMELPYIQGVTYKAFVDPSGGSNDSMTLAIGHVDRQSKRGVLDVLRERRPPFSPEAVVAEFADLLRNYRVVHVKGDYYGGEWPRDRFRASGITYIVSKKRKSDIYLEFLPLMNAGRADLLDERRLYNQLMALERRTSRGGHESIDHPPGNHDDLANVAAGVLVELLGKHDPTNIDLAFLARTAMVRTRRSLDDMRPGNLGPVWPFR
jgi:hypothetical protein